MEEKEGGRPGRADDRPSEAIAALDPGNVDAAHAPVAAECDCGSGGHGVPPDPVAEPLFDAYVLPSCILDGHGLVLVSNSRAREQFDVLPDRPFPEPLNQEAVARLDFAFSRARGEDGALAENVLLPGRDGVRVVDVHLGALPNDRYLLALTDVTKREELARRLEGVLDTARDAIITIGTDHRVRMFNKAAEAMFRIDADSARSLSIEAFIPPRLRQAHRGHVDEFARTSHPMRPMDRRRIVYGTRSDGEEFPVDAAISRYGEGDDALMTVVVRDISEELEAEDHLKLLEASIANIKDTLLITDTDLSGDGPHIVYANAAFEHLTGYRVDEVVGRNPGFLQGSGTSAEELRRIREALRREESVRAELVNYRKTGEPYWIELDISPLVDPEIGVTHFIAVQRDVTERRRLQEQLDQAQRLEALGQMTGGVAHDFNNQLMVIIGHAEEIAEHHVRDAELSRLAAVILTASQNASELVRGLLAFSRRQALQPRHVRINDSIRALRKLLSRVIEEHIEIRLDLAADAGEALVDPAQLESAVVNLAVNSRDAMPAGGRLVIGTALTELDESAAMERDLAPGRYVVIRVEDDGAGIPPEAIASVFEPFFTTKGIGQGTGLGLAMVYGFVRQSGGDVVIRSAPGEGTSVSLYLPAVEASVETGESSGGRRWSAGDGRRVLLVEDDPMVRHYTRTVLRRLGFEVLEAADGPQALALLEHPEQHLDLLLTDVLLPGGMSGRDVADAAAELRPDLPVVFASGYSRNELVGQGHLDSKVRLLDKPYRRVDLERVLAEVFDPE